MAELSKPNTEGRERRARGSTMEEVALLHMKEVLPEVIHQLQRQQVTTRNLAELRQTVRDSLDTTTYYALGWLDTADQSVKDAIRSLLYVQAVVERWCAEELP